MRRQFTIIAVIALVVGGVAGAGMSYAMAPAVQEPNAKGIISSCYKTADGQLRLVNTATTCSAGEKKLTWSQGTKKPAVHEVGAPGEVPYAPPSIYGQFKAYNGAPFGNLSFFKDASGVVHLTGLTCKASEADASLCDSAYFGNSTLQVFTLPKGFRPRAQQVLTTLSVGAGDYYHTRIDITTAGVVRLVALPEFGIDWISFDGVSFLSK